jgi:hypothetical protein
VPAPAADRPPAAAANRAGTTRNSCPGPAAPDIASSPWTKDFARVTADALAALGRLEEAVALRARYGLPSDDSR